MHSRKDDVGRKAMGFLKSLKPGEAVGAGAAVAGAVLLVAGLMLEGNAEGSGAGLRAVGGLLLISGLAVLFFAESRRRAATIGSIKRLYAWYMTRTARWRWPDRVGVAAVVLGLAWLVPVLLIQIIVGNSYGIMALGILSFCGGGILLIMGRFYRFWGEEKTSSGSQSSKKRGKKRWWR